MLRKTLLAAALAAAATSFSAHAVGNQVDVQVVDRSTGQTLSPIAYKGEWWIAGRPGARYSVTITNRNGGRTLNVISVDGVNALSGETAAWSQSGYVLDPYEATQINGWRKNLEQVAAFEFTALPDSYAARTRRPDHVGVIGVAVFNEREQPVAAGRAERERSDDKSAVPLPPPAPSQHGAPPASEPSASRDAPARTSAGEMRSAPAFLAKREKLGTGHGQIESSAVRWTRFDRQQSTPSEIVTIHYDRRENLIAMGIIPQPLPPVAVNPFPNSGSFVPDPPRRR